MFNNYKNVEQVLAPWTGWKLVNEKHYEVKLVTEHVKADITDSSIEN